MNRQTHLGVPENLGLSKQEILQDYFTCCLSRELSRLVRKEVLNGRAKFGSGGAGKEVPQVAMARAFQLGDFLSGYYREQTFMLAKELVNATEYVTFLYGDAENEKFSGGRQMPNCYGTAFLDENGNDLVHTELYNVASTIAPTGGHVGRALGIALASKKYRKNPIIHSPNPYSNEGNEVSFCTIGDASTSEGIFFETINAAGVMQVPLAMFVWDDGYGISVPKAYQTTKGSISAALEGFRGEGEGIRIHTLKAWDYAGLVRSIRSAVEQTRKSHQPVLIHVEDCTQPFGHSTSGSHERYKSKERLEWEKEVDCIRQMESWITSEGIADQETLTSIQESARDAAKAGQEQAWKRYSDANERKRKELDHLYIELIDKSLAKDNLLPIRERLMGLIHPVLSHLLDNARQMQFALLGEQKHLLEPLSNWIKDAEQTLSQRYHTHVYSESNQAAVKIKGVPATYDDNAPELNGFEILNAYFDQTLDRFPGVFAFGEDVGKIGDVNQAFAGLQAKYGEERVFDTGIREWSIVGQAIGMAMRGLRPIGELQYLDYLAYAFAPLTDDLASLRFRTIGQQMSPAIIRTRGHRLEGIWHSGSQIGMLLHSMRGICVLVPRNMTQAAGMYNTLLASDDPAIVIECLNGYRLKEKLPANLDTFRVAFGIPEILQKGDDVSLVTYGSCVRIAETGIELLRQKGISVELIDVQTLLPFDVNHIILTSLKKTNRIVFMDEDVPGGASAFMMQEVIEKQGGYRYLDSPPTTLTGSDHRPPFGDDGNYSSKPNANDVFLTIYRLMQEAEPERFPGLV